MTRIGPYGNGDCSKSYDGTLSLKGSVQVAEVECLMSEGRQPKGILYAHHGGSANLAARDGLLACNGSGVLNLLDFETLEIRRQIPTRVTCGFQGWDRVRITNGIAAHSVPSGLATIYWLENGLVSLKVGGDIGVKDSGWELVRVSGEGEIPTLPRTPNQHEWLGACDGNPNVVFALNGHFYGRIGVGVLGGKIVRLPSALNNPCYLSTPTEHYSVAPLISPIPKAAGGSFKFNGQLAIYRLAPDLSLSTVFSDPLMLVWGSGDGSYAAQPHCLQGGKIYAVTRADELSVIDTETWVPKKIRMPSCGFRPRIAVNRAGVAVVCGANQICRPGVWSSAIPLDEELDRSNKQFSNHLAIDDSRVYVARLMGGKLTIDARNLNDGKMAGKFDVPVAGSDPAGQCHDLFSGSGALYALVTPREPPVFASKFHQLIVRVS